MSDGVKRASIALSTPHLAGNEWAYVRECLDSGWVSSAGAYVDRFEKSVAEYLGAATAVATASGTAALHVSLLVSGVQPDDEVLVPSLTFIAPVNAVRYCGAHPVFMDCEPTTLCLDTAKVLRFFRDECEQRSDGLFNCRSGRRVKTVIPVHLFGHPVNMPSLAAGCRTSGVDIIEDATESLGSECEGRPTATHGTLGCLSFNGNKIITTGGGGMVITNDAALGQRVRHLTTQARTSTLEYEHDMVGYNYRLTNIQAALGVAQMEQLERFVEIKRRTAARYRELLAPIGGLEFVSERPGMKSNYWLNTIRVAAPHKEPLMRHMIARGIQVRPLFKPVHSLAIYAGFQSYAIEHATAAYATCLNLPSSVSLTGEEIGYVAGSIEEYFRTAA
jgi:perosamine synthetase